MEFGASSSGKTGDFGSPMRGFESYRSSHFKGIVQMKIIKYGLKAEISQELVDELQRKYGIDVKKETEKVLKEVFMKEKRK